MIFDFKKTSIYQALKWEKNPIFKLGRFLKILFFSAFLILLALFIFGALTEILSDEILAKVLGGIILSLVFWIFFWEISLFFKSKITQPKLKYSLSEAILRPDDFNLASYLDLPAARACRKAWRYSRKRKLTGIPGVVLLYYLISLKNEEIDFVFGRGGLSFQELGKQFKKELLEIRGEDKEKRDKEDSQDFLKIIFESAKIAQNRGEKRIGVGDILIAFSENNELFKKFLMLSDLKKEDIENLVNWYERIEEKIIEQKRFWDYENLVKKGSIGKDWAAGYTITLDKYSLDLREHLRKTGFKEIIGHKEETKQVERVLEKEEINNVLLVGTPGTGRESIVEAIAQQAFLGKSSSKINYKRILKFDLTALAAQIRSLEESETILDECFSQAVRAGNIILVIDEFHNFVSAASKPGTLDVSKILSRYLPLSSFQIIAITTYDGLHRVIERNPSLGNLFEKVEVAEIPERETLKFLENYVPFFERKHKRFISYKALREILRLGSRYLTQTPFPEKAIRLLDEAVSYLVLYTKDQILEQKHIKKIVSEKVEVPLGELEEKEKEVLLNLEQLIHKRIINQEEAVREVSAALRRARAEVQVRKGPIGSFLFLGPTGVGKTETSKVLTDVYFGGKKRMIRLDMSEFQNIEDIKRLLGSEGREGLLTTPVRENPFSLLLLDEIEKVHPNILNLFLQILDEGWVTAGDGRRVDFKNNIIIATSNAGAEIIRQDIKEDKKLDIIKEDLLDYLLKQGIFRPEFINRFDAVVVFKPLSKENLLDIVQLMLGSLKENLSDKGMEFLITEELKEKIVELGYSPTFGAREIRRVLQDKVENVLANSILSGRLKRGNTIEINPENFSLIIN